MKIKMSYQKNIAKLNQREYEVTQNKVTEPAFDNKYWDNKEEGLYIDIVSQEPLFSSTDKYNSGTGWPSFYEPISKNNVSEISDSSYDMNRIEILCSQCDAHLGHLFDDGPEPTGLRYCMNSLSLKFKKK